MVRFRGSAFGWLLSAALFGSVWGVVDASAADNGKAPAPRAAGRVAATPPTAKAPIKIAPEGLRFGMGANELVDFYGKVLDQDYVPVYKATPIGPKMKEVDAALAEQKAAMARSEVVFGDLPTGIDNTPLRGEYSYKNSETMMSVTRQGVTRYFFFFNQRLWKTYDLVPLKKDGELGATYQEAVGILTKKYGVAGRVLPEDAAHGRHATEVDWVDGGNHLRAIDRTGDSAVGLVIEERSTGERLAAFRASQKNETGDIDPSVSAVTRAGPSSDPNASAADVYTGKQHAAPASPAKKK
jgi:hypothetical protein